MHKRISLYTKEQIHSNVSQIRDFWLKDDVVDFMTKVCYLYNGYYVPTGIDNEIEEIPVNTLDDERVSVNEIIRLQLAGVILGNVEFEKALEGIKLAFRDNDYLFAKSFDDESAEPEEV